MRAPITETRQNPRLRFVDTDSQIRSRQAALAETELVRKHGWPEKPRNRPGRAVGRGVGYDRLASGLQAAVGSGLGSRTRLGGMEFTRGSLRTLVAGVLLSISALPSTTLTAEPSRADAREALRRAIRFFREEVAVDGGYVWRYSADLEKREGEGKLDHRTAWVQPPGTPFVGEAYLKVFELCREPSALEAAGETARALLRGQLHSGGWCERIDFEPAARRKRAYLLDGKPHRKARNISILDDDRTQSAIRFLARYDQITKFSDPSVGKAVRRALDALTQAQHRNGAWAQVFRSAAPDSGRPATLRASLRDGEYPRVKEYWDFYTLNDNVQSDCITTLLLAAEIYEEARYWDAAKRGGDFLLLAQLPEPQAGWAQQYDYDMHPAWARKFEPPAISGSEGPSVLRVLMALAAATGERKYLEPIPRALTYYRRSRLEDGRLARFYELRSNRPLYFNRRYELTYTDDDLPTHYSFQVRVDLESIARRFERLNASLVRSGTRLEKDRRTPKPPDSDLVRTVIGALDARGAWVEEGNLRYWGKGDTTRRIISPTSFARNVEILARFVGDSP